MNFNFLFFHWVKLLILYQFYRVKGSINGLKFFVEIDLRDFPKGFFEGREINGTIVICIKAPDFHFFVDRFRKYSRVLFGNEDILNRAFLNPDDEMGKL